MKTVSWLRAILAGIAGLVIAVVIAALANLLKPAPDIVWALVPICLSSILAAIVGYLIGARKKPAKTPAA